MITWMASVLAGMLASLSFYDLTHHERFPELARDVVGTLTIFGVFCLHEDNRQSRERFLLAAALTGFGVLLARTFRQMWEPL